MKFASNQIIDATDARLFFPRIRGYSTNTLFLHYALNQMVILNDACKRRCSQIRTSSEFVETYIQPSDLKSRSACLKAVEKENDD